MKAVRKGAAVITAVVFAMAASSALANDLLGTRVVADGSDNDVIQVPGDTRYDEVRLCVSQRSVHFQDIDVFFGNGDHHDVLVRLMVNPGECTRWFNMPGPSRNVTRIALHYDMLINAGQQAIVTAYGR